MQHSKTRVFRSSVTSTVAVRENYFSAVLGLRGGASPPMAPILQEIAMLKSEIAELRGGAVSVKVLDKTLDHSNSAYNNMKNKAGWIGTVGPMLFRT